MTTALAVDEVSTPHLIPVPDGGILSHVTRDCEDHHAECRCVGTADDVTGLIYWCATGEHLLTFR